MEQKQKESEAQLRTHNVTMAYRRIPLTTYYVVSVVINLVLDFVWYLR